MLHGYRYTDSFIIFSKTEDIYEDIENDVEKHLIHQILNSIDNYLKKKNK